MNRLRKEFIYVILSSLGIATLVFSTFWYLKVSSSPQKTGSADKPMMPAVKTDGLEKFRTEKEFKDYLTKTSSSSYDSLLGTRPLNNLRMEAADGLALKQTVPGMTSADISSPERYSGTNVQVRGIDEADIVKTDGQEIYFSSPTYRIQPLIGNIMPFPQPSGGTLSIKAFPPLSLRKESNIGRNGDLLLVDGTLVIIGENRIYGYDVKDPTNPAEKWAIELKNNSQIIASRLYRNSIYLVERTNISDARPCPIDILSGPEGEVRIPCADVYHPIVGTPVDATYTALNVKIENGTIEKTVSFVGSSNYSTIYMSKEFLYVTYYHPSDFIGLFYNFFSENSDLTGREIAEKLGRLQEYEISPAAKMTELTTIIGQYFGSFDNDGQMEKRNELTDRLDTYTKKHKRELDATVIVKIDLNDFSIFANGSVPGQLLNQFSLDEYQNVLRIATTVGGATMGFIGNAETANDVYVLDQNLVRSGEITDLGLTERIYSARFVEDKAYLVTFRQTDPFYVLDLDNPRDPRLAGQLKIPGFSSYLHPISKDLILGVGMENGKVKISLFDTSNPNDPTEKDKYNINDYWSEVQSTQHAFQIDRKFGVFFLPGGQGGYVFSYLDDRLELIKAVSNIRARRGLFIDDYFYVIGDDKIVVLSESNWEKVNELDL